MRFLVRYKYKMNPVTQNWEASARKFRDTWLMFFNLVSIKLPKNNLPPIKPLPLLSNFELGTQTTYGSKTTLARSQVKKQIVNGHRKVNYELEYTHKGT